MSKRMDQQNLVILMLSIITIFSLSGAIVLTLFDKKFPDSIINIACLCVGALGGMISTKDNKESSTKENSTDEIVHAIGQSAVMSILTSAQQKMEKNE